MLQGNWLIKYAEPEQKTFFLGVKGNSFPSFTLHLLFLPSHHVCYLAFWQSVKENYYPICLIQYDHIFSSQN